MEEITDFVVKVLIILGGLGLLFGAFFMLNFCLGVNYAINSPTIRRGS